MSNMFVKRQNALKIAAIRAQIINSIIAYKNEQASKLAAYRNKEALRIAAIQNEEALRIAAIQNEKALRNNANMNKRASNIVCKKENNANQCVYLPVTMQVNHENGIALTKLN
jgi:hypothetical protein